MVTHCAHVPGVCLNAALLYAASAVARDTDVEGCKDSPLISRFPGGAVAHNLSHDRRAKNRRVELAKQ